jgi:hypothetical protein
LARCSQASTAQVDRLPGPEDRCGATEPYCTGRWTVARPAAVTVCDRCTVSAPHNDPVTASPTSTLMAGRHCVIAAAIHPRRAVL